MDLLKHTTLEFDPYTVADKISLGVRTVSDESKWDQTHGLFAWSMRNPGGLRCPSRMGPAHRSTPTLYRSESYGMLSILCFLHRLAEHRPGSFTARNCGNWQPESLGHVAHNCPSRRIGDTAKPTYRTDD
jgi:hypothetical protein